MLRKILGGLLFVESALIIIGSIANGSFMSDQGSAAATYGAFVGMMIPVVVNILGGIFLLTFDKVYKQSYVDGFKLRSKQCSKFIVFIVIYALAMFLAGIGAGTSGADNFFLAFILAALPYFIPMMIFAMMLGVYAVPYWACQKNFKFNDTVLNEYISSNEVFTNYSEDGSVLASNKVLFFPKTFCIIPFDQIASTKFYNAIEQDIIFTLTNGKKVEIVANKKQYDSVVAAIEATKQ